MIAESKVRTNAPVIISDERIASVNGPVPDHAVDIEGKGK